MAKEKKAKIEPTLEELQAKKAKRQRGWVRFCAIILAVALTAGMFGMASRGEPTKIQVYPNVVQTGGGNTVTPPQTTTPAPQAPAATTPTPTTPSTSTPSTTTPEESGGLLDSLLGLLGGLDIGSILGNLGGLDLGGLGVTVGNGIQSFKDSLLNLIDKLEASLTRKPVITHDAVEYPFAADTDLGAEEDRQRIVDLLNEATAQAQNATRYRLDRKADYTPDGHVSVGEQTETINQILGAASLSLDQIVGSFVGVGNILTDVTPDMDLTDREDSLKEEYFLMPTQLTADDIQIVSAYDAPAGTGAYSEYSIRLKNVDHPNRQSDCGLTRLTNDYLVQNEVAAEIQSRVLPNNTDFGVLKLTDLIMRYSDIQVSFRVNDRGQLINLSYTYTAYGKFTVRTNTVQVIGDSTTTTTTTYNNFIYPAVTG